MPVRLQTVRDRDLVIDKKGVIYQVIGSIHTPSHVYALAKYLPTWGSTPWRIHSISLQRLFREYSPHVVNLSDVHCISSEYKSVVPCISVDDIASIKFPEEGVKRIIGRVRDRLESIALMLLYEITQLGLASWDTLGITGSLLGGFHNPLKSDIDLVLYASSPPSELGSEVGKPLTGRLLVEWINRNSRKLGLHPSLVRLLYDSRRRFLYCDKLVSIIVVPPRHFNIDKLRSHFAIKGEYTGIVEAFLEKEADNELSEYFYPHVSIFTLDSIVKGVRLRPGTLVKIISFESIFSGFDRFSRVYVRGKAFYENHRDVAYFVVGTREERTFAVPVLDSSISRISHVQ